MSRQFDDREIKLSNADKKQYEKDVATFTLLLNQGKDIPKDLGDRLLKIKRLLGK